MFIILLLGYIYKDRLTMRVIAISMIMVIAAFVIYNETPFLREKVEEQLSLSKDWESNESLISANRFTTSLLDFYYIEKSPFIGNTDNQKFVIETMMPYCMLWKIKEDMVPEVVQHGKWLLMESLCIYYGYFYLAIHYANFIARKRP